ncbi:hypothetical protein AB6A40_000013 [Gnathostoma spinigerum]|uniref:Uncharacterized protein n=1 Tax=Gnathostoma spinigerum TaxID=75299 RepID=A0ABD6E149_9BILA
MRKRVMSLNLLSFLLFFLVICTNGQASSTDDRGETEEIKQVIVCEGGQANFSCPEGTFIAIRLANYGRFTISQCNPTFNTELSTTCQNDKTLSILQLTCNGQNECEFPVNNDYLGDPCPGTSKYLDLEYECTSNSERRITTTTTSITTTSSSPLRRRPMTTAVEAHSIQQSLTSFTGRPIDKGRGKYCAAKFHRDIEWPMTEAGRVARMSCPIGSDGHAEWDCDRTGNWSSGGPDLSRCISSWTQRLREDAQQLEDPVERLETLREIQQMTRKEPLLGGDLIALSFAISASVSTEMDSYNVDSFTELVVESVNNMAKESQSAAWDDLNIVKSRKVADTLMASVDKVALSASVLTAADTTKTIIKPTIELEISNIRVHEYVTFPSMSLYKNTYDTVEVPREALTLRNDATDHAKVVYVTYSAMGSHIEPEPILESNNELVRRIVASNVVSASVIGDDDKIHMIHRLQQPVIIAFHTKTWANLSKPTCVWWNRTQLGWSSSGCRVHKTNRSHTICHCDHLTHFAVLMDIRSNEIPIEHEVTLTFVTYVGCTLSIVCLFLSLFAFHCFGTSGGDRICIHKNLCFSLLIAESVFLLGIWRTEDQLSCSVIATILHYSFLCAFAWMLLEGFELYYMLVEVFQTRDSKRLYLYAFGYGFPGLIVALTFWYDKTSYGTVQYCWMKADSAFVLFFIGPVAVVLFLNCVFLFMTLIIVCRHSNVGYAPCKQDKDTINSVRNWLKGAVALAILLGLTWTLGLLWIDEQSILLAYAFTVLNSLQGLFIFLFHVVFNDRMNKDYQKWVKRNPWLPDCMRTRDSTSQPSPPYPPTSSATVRGFSSNSSTASDLLYPSSATEKYPQAMTAIIDSRYSNSVQMLLARQGFANNGPYDYASIAYGDVFDPHSPHNPYFSPIQFQAHRSHSHRHSSSHYRPPPNFPPPPPPQAIFESFGSPRPHNSTLTKLSDDSAYSDGSSNAHDNAEFGYNPGMILRMDLTKNPPVFVQGL